MKKHDFLRGSLWSGLVAVLVTGIVGCGGGESLQPVTGRVVYADGSPVPAGSVTFNHTEKQIAATGLIGPDGMFSLTFGDSQGAPAGNYRVVVTGDTETYGAPPTVANIYGDPSQTPLTQEIVEGKNEVEIKVARPK